MIPEIISQKYYLGKWGWELFLKKNTLEVVFEFFHTNPQLDHNIKPTRNLSGIYIYIYILVLYMGIAFNIS